MCYYYDYDSFIFKQSTCFTLTITFLNAGFGQNNQHVWTDFERSLDTKHANRDRLNLTLLFRILCHLGGQQAYGSNDCYDFIPC